MESSYIQELNPDTLIDYKERARELLGSFSNNDTVEQAQAVTNAALTLGITLRHAGLLKGPTLGSLFSDESASGIGSLKEAGKNALGSIKQLVQGNVDNLTDQGTTLIATTRGQGEGLVNGLIGQARGLAGEGEGAVRGLIGQARGLVGEGEGLVSQGRGLLTGLREGAQNLVNRVSSRLGNNNFLNRPANANDDGMVFRNAIFDPNAEDNFVASPELQAFNNPITTTGQITSADMAELRSAVPDQVSRILNGDVTELGQGMSDRLFNLLTDSRERLVQTGRTIAQTATDNIYSHSAGDAINQARLNGELQTRPSEPATQASPEPQTPTTLQEPGHASNANQLAENSVRGNVGTQDDSAIAGEESLEQTGEQTLKSTATSLAKSAVGDTLDELTAGSTILDETGIGDVLTIGLGIADLFETIFGLSKKSEPQPVIQSGQQVGV